MQRAYLLVIGLIGATVAPGCTLRRDNTSCTLTEWRPRSDSVVYRFLEVHYFVPGRDYVFLTWLGRGLFGDVAWNLTPDGEVSDGPFFVNRDIAATTPEQIRAGPQTGPPPTPPWTIKRRKNSGGTGGFIGTDARGRDYLVKVDRPEYPELGTGAEMIASRAVWLLGYHVPSIYLVTIEGTGDASFDGRRATASPMLEGEPLGAWDFDSFRMRREVRALRLVSAWLNDSDRIDTNTLAVRIQPRTEVSGPITEPVVFYQVDFNSSLGSWNGRPKDPWRGWRHAWDVEYQLLAVLTLGLLPRLPADTPILSPAVGTFDLLTHDSARAWRPQMPNTAFDRLTETDAAWICHRLKAISDDQLRALVEAAGFSHSTDGEAVLNMLVARRERILDAYGESERASTTRATTQSTR